MNRADLVREGVGRLEAELRGMRFGRVTLAVVVRDGRVVRAELTRAETFEEGHDDAAQHGASATGGAS